MFKKRKHCYMCGEHKRVKRKEGRTIEDGWWVCPDCMDRNIDDEVTEEAEQ